MQYIFINPVVDKMYNKEELNEVLVKNNYKRIGVEKDWHGIVKEKYKEVINCPVMNALKNMIGKPIYLTDYTGDIECGVYLGFDFNATQGFPMIKYRKGMEDELTAIIPTSKLMTENNNGEKITLAQNNAEAFNEELEKLLPSTEYLERFTK